MKEISNTKIEQPYKIENWTGDIIKSITDKKSIRASVTKIRNLMSDGEVFGKSIEICKRVLIQPEYIGCKNICLYYPINNEVDVTLLFESCACDKKSIWLPKVSGTLMDFYLYTGENDLSEGKYGIKEPVSDIKLTPSEDTLIVVPGTVFSRRKERIGYGGGYYDRYISLHEGASHIAVCYGFQLKDSLPVEQHDIYMNKIIYENGIIE